ncbi:MAG: hypothetical protein HYX61_00395 [Gammaproteobacteria bacterium]|nr:hypothetical protein [Gammaproteobacteria bacterium]
MFVTYDRKEACFGDLFELTIEDAAQKLYEGLWDPDQASISDIKKALEEAVENGELSLVRGCIKPVGAYTYNSAIFDMRKVLDWTVEKGLHLNTDIDPWKKYIYEEESAHTFLEIKLEAIRSLQRSGGSKSAIFKKMKLDFLEDQLVTLIVENEELKNKLNQGLTKTNQIKENPKSLNSLLKIIITLAMDGYGYDPYANKSSIPKEISDLVFEKINEEIDPDTVRAWLKLAKDQFLPNTKPNSVLSKPK